METQLASLNSGMKRNQTVTLTWRVTSSKEHIKQVLRWDISLKVPTVLVLSWRVSRLFSTLIVLSSFVRITQNSICIPDSCGEIMFNDIFKKTDKCFNTANCVTPTSAQVTFKRLRCSRSVILVRMEFQSEFSVWSFQVIVRGVFLHSENFIEVFALFYPVQGTDDLQCYATHWEVNSTYSKCTLFPPLTEKMSLFHGTSTSSSVNLEYTLPPHWC